MTELLTMVPEVVWWVLAPFVLFGLVILYAATARGDMMHIGIMAHVIAFGAAVLYVGFLIGRLIFG